MNSTKTRLACLLALALFGCKGGGAASDAMALLPKESSIVFSVNLDRLRGSKLWGSLVEIKNEGPAKKDYDEFVTRTGLDPLAQLTLLVGGVAPEGEQSKDFAVVLKGKFDEQKIVSYMKDKAKDKDKMKTESYGGKTIYTGGDDDTGMCFLDGSTVALAGKSWIRKVIDLSGGKGENVTKNATVQALVKRAKTDQGLWVAGVVPAGKAPLPSGGEVKSIVINADFAQGMTADVLAEAPTADQAKKMTDDAQKQIGQLKQNPMMAMSGMGPLIDGMKITTEGASMHVALAMNQQQFDELATRIKGMAKMFGGMAGGMGGMPGPGGAMPPGAMPPGPGAAPAAPGTEPAAPAAPAAGTAKHHGTAGGKHHRR